MGSFSSTCMVSNLSIASGDPIVKIILCENPIKSDHMALYPGNRWCPVGLPIFGSYDDYGRLENPQEDASTQFTVELINNMGADEIVTLEDLCGRDFVGTTITTNNLFKRKVTLNHTWMHRRMWDYLVHELKFETYNAPDYKDVYVKNIDYYTKAVQTAIEKYDERMKSYSQIVLPNNDELMKLSLQIAEFDIEQSIRGQEGDYMFGGLELFQQNRNLFVEKWPEMMALRFSMYLHRKTFEPLQCVGEQYTPANRFDGFFAACRDIVRKKKQEI